VKSQEEKLKSEQCRRILEALESGPQTTAELSKATKLTLGSVEKHLEVLMVAELVHQEGGYFAANSARR